MLHKLFKDKKARFVDFKRSITVGNFFFFVVMSLVLIFVISFLINKIFPSIEIIKVGVPFKFLIIGAGLSLAFYIITRRQGGLDRTDIFSIILLGGIMVTLFLTLPQMLPEIFSSLPPQTVIPAESDPFVIFSNVSQTIYQGMQSIITP